MNTILRIAKNKGVLPVSRIASCIFFAIYTARYPEAEVIYKVDNIYAPDHESGLLWNDSQVGIKWPINNPILAEKDKKWPSLEQLEERNELF